MKILLSILVLSISISAVACPSLAGKYHQCKLVAAESTMDEYYGNIGYDIKETLNSRDNLDIYKIIQIGDPEEVELELSPLETFVIGETRNIKSKSPDQDGETEELIATASCSDTTVKLEAKIKLQNESETMSADVGSMVYEKLKTGNLKITTTSVAFWTEDEETQVEVAECELVK